MTELESPSLRACGLIAALGYWSEGVSPHHFRKLGRGELLERHPPRLGDAILVTALGLWSEGISPDSFRKLRRGDLLPPARVTEPPLRRL
jgi:hypothetical protein